jgi:hypothetical protein
MELSSKEDQDKFSVKLDDCRSKGHQVYTEVSTGAYLPVPHPLMLGISAACTQCAWSDAIRML